MSPCPPAVPAPDDPNSFATFASIAGVHRLTEPVAVDEDLLLDLLAQGAGAAEAAVRLGLPLTVLAQHLSDLRGRYGTTSTAEAVRRARAGGR